MALKGKVQFELLEDILKLKRPANGCTEREAINKFIRPTGAIADTFGNYHLKLGEAPIVWSCHTDTVHDKNGTQAIVYGEKDQCIYLDETIKKAECLGADDGAGIWLMLEMIEAGVSGHYVFHREEECGGGGSSFLSSDPSWIEYFKDYKCVIALDRRGYNDVITHQGARTCSDAFAQELSDQLNVLMYKDTLDTTDKDVVKYYQWKPSTGVWTDSANYTDMVGECTNLSVGYFNQHSYKECLDPDFLLELLTALKHLDTTALVASCSRKAGEREVFKQPVWNSRRGNQMVPTDGGTFFDDELYTQSMKAHLGMDDLNDDTGWGYTDMSDVVEQYPDEVASILKAQGYGVFDLLDEVDKISGAINS